MDDLELDRDLRTLDQHLATLSKRVEPDPSHHARLRQELLRRHQELRTEHTQRAVPTLWSRFPGLKRLTLVAPPALAGAAALLAVISGAGFSGHHNPQIAEAAQITQALAHTAPTVTAWQVSVQQQSGNSIASVVCPYSLGTDQHFFVRDGRAYFYDGKAWYRVSTSLSGGSAQCPLDIQWAFAILPAHLENGNFTILPDRTLGGIRVRGVRYSVRTGSGVSTSTEWVNLASGLVARAERVIRRGSHIVERDRAVYSYTRA
jgi:hypothetical protein